VDDAELVLGQAIRGGIAPFGEEEGTDDLPVVIGEAFDMGAGGGVALAVVDVEDEPFRFAWHGGDDEEAFGGEVLEEGDDTGGVHAKGPPSTVLSDAGAWLGRENAFWGGSRGILGLV